MAHYDNGRFSFLQPEKRLRSRLTPYGNLSMVPLAKLMNVQSAEWLAALGTGGSAGANYASAAALTWYFYHLDGDGKGTHFKNYIRAVEKQGGSNEALMKEHLLRGRDWKALEKDVQKAFRRERITVVFPD
jgi:hypothetical protein